MFRKAAPAGINRLGWIVLGVIVSLSTASSAQQPPAGQPPAGQPAATQPPSGQPAQQAQQAPTKRVFANDGGMVLNFIKPDQTAAFEAVIAKL